MFEVKLVVRMLNVRVKVMSVGVDRLGGKEPHRLSTVIMMPLSVSCLFSILAAARQPANFLEDLLLHE